MALPPLLKEPEHNSVGNVVPTYNDLILVAKKRIRTGFLHHTASKGETNLQLNEQYSLRFVKINDYNVDVELVCHGLGSSLGKQSWSYDKSKALKKQELINKEKERLLSIEQEKNRFKKSAEVIEL